MKKIILLLLLATNVYSAEQLLTIPASKGIVDEVSPDSLSLEYSPDSKNVYFDEVQNSVVKRKGSLQYLTTPLTETQSIRRLYEYKQVDGDKYLIFQSSYSLYYSLGNGAATTIITTASVTSNFNFSIGEDLLLGTNGADPCFDWNGTTFTSLGVTNSTNVPCGKYNIYWHNRWWIANVTGLTSRVYYSEVNDHRNFDSANLNYININVSDGQQITGLFTSNDSLIITKDHSTYEIYSAAPPDPDNLIDEVFDARALSPDIGCLYQSSMATYKGLYPSWVSHRGIELFDGQFNLISSPINKLVKSFRQLNVGISQIIYTSASDWGLGSGTNIDTTTYSGSVSMPTISQFGDVYMSNNAGSFLIAGVGPNVPIYARQKFYAAYDMSLAEIQCNLVLALGTYDDIVVSIKDSNLNTMETKNIPTSGGSGDFGVTFSTSLIANNTYYLSVMVKHISGSGSFKINSGDYLQYVSTTAEISTDGTNWSYSSSNMKLKIWSKDLSPSSYTTIISTATNWGTWGTFSVDDTKPIGSAITYYVKTSTAINNFASKAPVLITNGQTITSTVGSYIQVIASFTRTDATVIPKINEITIKYTGSSTAEPIITSYDDRLYCSFDNGSGYNDLILVYDSNGQWTKLSGNWGSSCVYDEHLYSGDSTNTGKIYKQDVDNLYTDDGSNYEAYWMTALMNMNTTINEKNYYELWTTAKYEEIGLLDVYYKLYGDTADFTQFSGSIDLHNDYNGMNNYKLTFPSSTKSYYLQLKLGATNAYPFEIRKLDLIYEVLPRR